MVTLSDSMKYHIFFLILINICITSYCQASTHLPSQSYYGILSPMHEEGVAILNKMSNKHDIKIDGITYTLGILNGKRVVHAFTGIGKVNAAITTYGLITNFHPSVIILEGIAGSVNPTLNIGDVVLGNIVYALEQDKVQIKNLNNLNPINNKLTPSFYRPDSDLLNIANKLKYKQSFKVILGKIATSDSLPNSKYQIMQLKKDKADAIDMETAAVSHVCWLFKTPWLAIRAISNSMAINLAVDQQKHSFKVPKKAKEIAVLHAADFTVSVTETGMGSNN